MKILKRENIIIIASTHDKDDEIVIPGLIKTHNKFPNWKKTKRLFVEGAGATLSSGLARKSHRPCRTLYSVRELVEWLMRILLQ